MAFRKVIFSEKDLWGITSYKVSKRKDGRFCARVLIGIDDERKNKYIYKCFYGGTVAATRQKISEFIKEQITSAEEKTTNDALLVTEMEKWLQSQYGTVRSTTYDRLEQTFIHQVKPFIEGLKFSDVTEDDCSRLVSITKERGYSFSTIKKVYWLLHAFFERKHKSGKVKINPMAEVKLPTAEHVREFQKELRQERKKLQNADEASLGKTDLALKNSRLKMDDSEESRCFSDEEIEKIRNVVENGYYIRWKTKTGKDAISGPWFIAQGKFFLFLLNTGPRRGEACALKYKNIDFARHTMFVQSNEVTCKKRDKFGRAISGYENLERDPKTAHSKAILPISDYAISLLKDLLQSEPEGYDGYIVHDESGKMISTHALYKRFNNLLRHAGVAPAGLHALRHTFATKLFISKGGDAQAAAEFLRHNSADVTEQFYIHLTDEFKSNVVKDLMI